jgi:hypothetical protein
MKHTYYLKEGHPIASGVIEGVYRHFAKVRMDHCGMRWKLERAFSMLTLRAAFQSDYWTLL